MRCALPFRSLLIVALSVAACETDVGRGTDQAADTAAAVTATGSAGAPKPGQFAQPPRPIFEPNPLGLPGSLPTVTPDTLVYTVPKNALERARLGSTFVLRAAAVVGTEGGNVVVRMGREPSYSVHPAYVITPRAGAVRRGSPVLAPHHGLLAHAIVTAVKRAQVTVRYIDAGPGYGDQPLASKDVALQSQGLQPGNYAAYAEGESFRHALLLSVATHSDGKRRWLVLGYGGACALVDEDKLRPIALGYAPKVGTVVSVAWLGTMVPAKVTAVDVVGTFTVRRARVASALVVGPGLLMPPPS